uniref:Uncharacterized protein n=1 Tax=Amblyomma maculatum TaxID=34609 RepID=G3MQ21_AMBMU
MLDAGRRGFIVKITYCAFFLFKLCAGGLFSGALVYPKIMEGRADDGSILLLVEEDFTVYLDKSDVLAQDFNVTIENDTYSDTVVLNGADLQKDLYHNSDNYSSLVVRRKQRVWEVEGIVNHEFRIRPVNGAERAPDGTVLHKVVKVEERSTEDSMLIRSETDGTSSGSSTGSEADGTAAGSGAGTGSEAGGTSSGSSTGSGTSDTAPGSNSEQTAKKMRISSILSVSNSASL